jgi:hypothetical protein
VGRVLLVCCNLHGLIVESKQNPGTSDVLQCRKRFGGDDDMSYKWYCANGPDLAFSSTAYAIGSVNLSLPRSLFINTEVWALHL